MSLEPTKYEEELAGWVDDQLFDTLLDSLAFADFEEKMDEQLDLLVAQWGHRAAPNAGVVRRSANFPSAKPTAKPVAKPKPK